MKDVASGYNDDHSLGLKRVLGVRDLVLGITVIIGQEFLVVLVKLLMPMAGRSFLICVPLLLPAALQHCAMLSLPHGAGFGSAYTLFLCGIWRNFCMDYWLGFIDGYAIGNIAVAISWAIISF